MTTTEISDENLYSTESESETTETGDEAMATETITLAGGCFWCVEAVFVELKGVSKSVSGYCGGQVPNPTYEQICTGRTGHAEAIQITYDPKIISLRDIFRIFLTTHDPTTLNRQGPDSGTQYRSAIFVKSADEKRVAQEIIKEVSDERVWPGRIVTTIEPLTQFYIAEEYHQNYYQRFNDPNNPYRNQMNGSYCSYIIAPKVVKFRKQYADKLKKR
jgi:peptide-methionine (S)-S-oxide reductase